MDFKRFIFPYCRVITGLLLLLLSAACNDDIFVDAPAGDEDLTAVVEGEGGEAQFFLSRKSLVSLTVDSYSNNLTYYDRAGNIISADSPVAEIACISCESIWSSWKIKIDGNSLHFISIENCTGSQQIEYIRAVYDYGSDVVYVIYIEPGRPLELESVSYDGNIDVRHDATIKTDRFRFNNNSPLPQKYEFMPYLQARPACIVEPDDSWAKYERVNMMLPVYEGGQWDFREYEDVKLGVSRMLPFDIMQKMTVAIEPMSDVLITSSIVYDEATARGTIVFRTPVSGRRLATAFSAITAWPVRNDIEINDAQ